MSRPNCSMEDQVEAMQAKVAKWVNGIWTKHINATNACYCLNSTIMKTLECPLMATTLTEENSGAIMWPLLQAALPKCRVQKHFPPSLCSAPNGPRDLTSPASPSPKQSNMSKPSSGMATDCHPPMTSTCTTWKQSSVAWALKPPLRIVWGPCPRRLDEVHLATLVPHQSYSPRPLSCGRPQAPTQCVHDGCSVPRGMTLHSRQHINELRFHLGGTTLSDFCNAAGTHIDPWTWKGKQRSRLVQSHAWPATQPPSPNAVEHWQVMLNLLFSDPASPTHALRTPLGPSLARTTRF